MSRRMIPRQCDVCSKQFSGAIPAEQHFASQEHIKKAETARLARNSGKYCDVCNIVCDTVNILQQHVQSPRHLATLEKRRSMQSFSPGFGNSSPRSSNSNSRGHTPVNEDPSDKEYVFSRITNKGFCNLCNIELTSQSHAQSHISGSKHQKRSERHKDLTKRFGYSWHTDHGFIGIDMKPTASQLQTPAAAASAYSWHNCSICCLYFNSPSQEEEHIVSDKHLNKVLMLIEKNGFVEPALTCTPCGSTFRDQEEEEDHMKSKSHKDQVVLVERKKRENGNKMFVGTAASTTTPSSDTTGSLYCEVCSVPFTSQGNKDDHMKGKKHLRNVENMNIRLAHERNAPKPEATTIKSPITANNASNPTINDFGNNTASTPLDNSRYTGIQKEITPETQQNQLNFYQEEKDVVKQTLDFNGCRTHPEDSYLLDSRNNNGNDSEDDDESLFIKPCSPGAGIDQVAENMGRISLGNQHITSTNNRNNPQFAAAADDDEKDDSAKDLHHLDKAETLSIRSFAASAFTSNDMESELDSGRFTVNYREVRNNLTNSQPLSFPIGRGRGLLMYEGKVKEKAVNKDSNMKQETQMVGQSFGLDKSCFGEDETTRKGVWNSENDDMPALEKSLTVRHSNGPNFSNFSTQMPQVPKFSTQMPPELGNFSTQTPPVHRGSETFQNLTRRTSLPDDMISESGDSLLGEGIQFPVREDSYVSFEPFDTGNDPMVTGTSLANQRFQPIGTPEESREYYFDDQLGIGKCFVCNIDFTSWQHKDQHVNGKNHRKAKFGTRVIESYGCQGTSPNHFFCDVCKVPCSSQGNYEQHVLGAQHKKMVGNSSTNSPNHFFCDVCKVPCSSQGNYEQHVLGAHHKKMVENSQSGNRMETYVCEICNVPCSSRGNYEQHLQGAQHRKNAARGNVGRTASIETFYCDVCQVPCSSRGNYEQHLEGAQHKKMAAMGNVGKRTSVETLYCDVCQVPCSSRGNYEQHLQGSQHRKMSGMSSPSNLADGIDRTIWFPCRVCKCNLNSAEQLRIHQNSPAHKAKLAKQNGMGDMGIGSDNTLWFTCKVCNCSLNTREQLLIHERSPKHLAKMAKLGSSPQQVAPFYQSNPVPERLQSPTKGYSQQPQVPHCTNQRDVFETPLDSFLSQELFPEEFLPPEMTQTQQSASPVQLQMTDDPFVFPDRFAVQTNFTDSGNVNQNQGGSKPRGQSSDLAYATRNKGNTGSSQGKTATDMATNRNTNAVNPYAQTHRFYCHTCRVPMNTQESYEGHLRGKRHLQKVCTEPAPIREHLEGRQLYDDFKPHTQTRPRNYQYELYKKALSDDSLVFLPTGTGKTMVSVMTMSAMLERYPTKNILFLVDKVLLVFQQAKYIRQELGDRAYTRFSGDSEDFTELENRVLRIAGLCMGQQSTGGIPLWKHDVVVVTAGFCQNLIEKGVLRWRDFSLVVFDEAHHCEKAHPFNTILSKYHQPLIGQLHVPRILGLTASPAGKSDLPKTVQMLRALISNMGGVKMTVVEEPVCVRTLAQYQSNAVMETKTLGPNVQGEIEDVFLVTFRQELNVYIFRCMLLFLEISNIKDYMTVRQEIKPGLQDGIIRMVANDFVEGQLDVIQSSVMMIENTVNTDKVKFSYLQKHVQDVCMARSSLYDGGIICAFRALVELDRTDYGFQFARTYNLQTVALEELLKKNRDTEFQTSFSADDGSPIDAHACHLIDQLTSFEFGQNTRRISLVLVKQRSTAYHLSKLLEESPRMREAGLRTATVVGHGSSGTAGGMSVNQQKRVLEEIKQYIYQVIIATSVAEEGVDWPECDHVISMYPPTTVTALIQMRGRARRKDSKFIILCNSADEETKLREIMEREKNMIAATQIVIRDG